MSSGHAHKKPAEADEAELDRLLADKRLKEYMNRPYERHWWPMVLTGGSSQDGKHYYLDPQLQRPWRTNRGPTLLDKFVLLHERFEKAFRAVCGLSYARAHHFATLVEKRAVEAAGIVWETYKRVMAAIVRSDERERRDMDFPPGFDMVPVRDWERERSHAT